MRGCGWLMMSLTLTSCSHDWDGLDPTASTGAGGSGATGATGGSTTSTGGDGGQTAGGAGGGGTSVGGGGSGGVPLGPFEDPHLVRELSHPEDDDDPSFTADGLELYFNTHRDPNSSQGQVWRANRLSLADPWGAPSPVDELNTIGTLGNEIISPDGLTLWFDHSPGMGTGVEIYVTTRASSAAPFAAPLIDTQLSSGSNDGTGAITSDGLLFVMDSNRPGGLGGTDIYFATRRSIDDPWDTPVLAVGLNTADSEGQAWISEDGLTLYFDSNRPGGAGGSDIWMTERSTLEDDFAPPINVTELNTELDDSDPWLTPDLRYVMFSREPADGGPRELYEASR